MYQTHGFQLTQKQLQKLHGNPHGATLNLKNNNLSGPHILTLPSHLINKVKKALVSGKGVRLNLSKTCCQKNVKGGYIGGGCGYDDGPMDYVNGERAQTLGQYGYLAPDVPGQRVVVNPSTGYERGVMLDELALKHYERDEGMADYIYTKRGKGIPIAAVASKAMDIHGQINEKTKENQERVSSIIRRRIKQLNGGAVMINNISQEFLEGALKGVHHKGPLPRMGSGTVTEFMDGFWYGFNPANWPELINLAAAEIDDAIEGKGYNKTSKCNKCTTIQGDGIVFL